MIWGYKYTDAVADQRRFFYLYLHRFYNIWTITAAFVSTYAVFYCHEHSLFFTFTINLLFYGIASSY